MIIHMYIAPGWGQMNPQWFQMFTDLLIFSPTANFMQDFPLKDILTVSLFIGNVT